MSGISLRENTYFNVENEYIERMLKTVNTALIGKVLSVNENKATINIENKYPKLMKDGEVEYVPYGKLTTNVATLSLFKYTPKVDDIVMVIVFQSNVQNILNNDENEYPHSFNIFDSVVIPITINYSDSTKITEGDSGTDIDLSAKDYELNVEKVTANVSSDFNLTSSQFSIIDSKNSENLLALISQTFTAIGAVMVDGNSIDSLTGGLVGENATKILGFS